MPTVDQIALALSDPIRLRILDIIAAGRDEDCCSPIRPDTPDGICACDLQPELEIAPTRLAYHIKALREAGLIREQKSGRWVYFSLNREAMAAFVRLVDSRFLQVLPNQACCSPLIKLDSLETP